MNFGQEIEVDNFAGGGGASEGIEAATGRSVAVAVNHDPEAVAMHTANHPGAEHLCQSVWRADPRDVARGRPVGLAWFSPDCFVPGTLVLTSDGQKPIENIAVGDLVLTHRGRWRPVTSTMAREADTVLVRGQGHYGLITTPNHQFYSKVITRRWPRGKKVNGKRKGLLRTLVENPYWPEAQKMAGRMWATPRTFPAAAIPVCNVSFSDDFFYFLGRWIGDGSLNKGDVEICCGAKECDEFERHLNDHPLRDGEGVVVPHRVVDHGSSRLFVWGNASLARWLEREVQSSSERKQLPLWCLSMQRSWREELLAGYVDADGCIEPAGVYQTSSVSKALSIGIRLLANGLGNAVSLYRTLGGAGQIEGRSFIARDGYVVRWRPNNAKETTFSDTLHTFYGVKEVTTAGLRPVISLQVAEDESFVADGIVVHNCRHFSKAKGGQPVAHNIRDLAWVVVHWAQLVRPRVIILENVEEFREWGPLIEGTDGKLIPCPLRKGLTYRRWRRELVKLGYHVEERELRACDYGAPTSRKRLFVIARCDGQPIVWPAPTHGPGRAQPWATAADIIDWSLPCPSIFLTREEGRLVGVRRPLSDNTMRRIAAGVKRYVFDDPDPFILPTADGSTIPTLIQTGYGERKGQAPRVPGLHKPLGTVVGCGQRHALVAPVIVKQNFGSKPAHGVTEPLHTITTQHNKHTLVAAFLAQHNTDMVGHRAEKPLSTIVQKGCTQAVVASHLVNLKGSERRSRGIREPAPTVCGGGEHLSEVRAFLLKYYGTDQDPRLREPVDTLTTKARFGLVVVAGEVYQIADIGMRMLTPRELFRAQGFRESYIIDPLCDGKPIAKTAQIRCCGNSVCPPLAEALVRANYVAGADLGVEIKTGAD